MTSANILRPNRTPQMSEATLGMLLMGVAMALLPVSDTFSKLLTDHLAPIEVTFARLLAQGLFLVPAALILRHRLKGPMLSPIVALSGLLVMVTLTSL
ncbi:MAG TPA: EamA/RhaT family transporter, partial [Paracoccus sp.]|nr:EamA/RhaT family transporter [Paracoccus sp. (in: a-proteobacteria)]